MIKKHWPILFTFIVVVVGIILGMMASKSTDAGVAIAVGVILFMFLFPLDGAVIGGWYGWRLRSPVKWLLAPAVYLGVCLYMVVWDLTGETGSLDPGSYLPIGSFTGIACLVTEFVICVIAWLRKKARVGKDKSKI